MKYDNVEQVPEGMMDRIEERLVEHTVARNRKKKVRIIALAAALVLILPISGFAVVNFDWGWNQGIRVAAENGKSVELNTTLTYNNHSIKFENAVWEQYALLISYSINDFDAEGAVIPSEMSLVNEEGVSVSHGAGTEYNGKGKGNLRFDLENKLINGEKLYLLIHTLQNAKLQQNQFKYEINLDKNLLLEGKAKVDFEASIDYGTLKINSARYDKGRLYLGYSMDELEEIKKLKNYDKKSHVNVHNLFPHIALKDASGKIVKSNGRTSDPEGNTGEISFEGAPEDINQPISMSIICAEKPVGWKLPIKIFRPETKIINVDRKIKIDGGTLKINNLCLGQASTYMDYIFTAEKNSYVTRVEPFISAFSGGKKYEVTVDNENLSGKLICKYPLSEADLNQTVFKLIAINKTVSYDKTVELESKKVPFNFDINGTDIQVSKMEVKNGKTKIELEVSDVKRKFADFETDVKVDDSFISCSMGSTSKFVDKSAEERFNSNPDLLTQEDITKTIVTKTIEIDGEYDKVTLRIPKLNYIYVVNTEIKIR